MNNDFNDLEPLRSTSLDNHSKGSAPNKKKTRRKQFKRLFRRFLFLAALLVFIISMGLMILRLLDYKKGDDIYNAAEDSVFREDSTTQKVVEIPIVKPVVNPTVSDSEVQATTAATEGETETAVVTIMTNYDHSALLALNSDGVGYLQIPAINILLPVVQGSDNSFYLKHAITGANSQNGTLFIDTRCKEGIDSSNCIIYGHNMLNGAMFGRLKKFTDASFFQAGTNRYFYFYTENHIYMYEIYSVHGVNAVGDAYQTYFADSEDFLSYLNKMQRGSYHSTSPVFSADSKTITLSTCTGDNSTRLIVQGIRIGEVEP